MSISAYSAPLQVVSGEFDSGRIYVTCEFDNISKNCFVDTGSTISAVADERFAAYPVTGRLQYKSASGIPKAVDEISIERLRIGLAEHRQVKVARFDPIDGLESVLGINLLVGEPFAFQFRPSPILLPNAPAPSELLNSLTVHEKNIVSIPIQIGADRMNALWDTGAGLSSVDVEYVQTHPHEFDFIQDIDNGFDGTGKPVAMKLYSIKEIKIGPRLFKNEKVLAIDFSIVRDHISKDIALILGFNLITKMNWFFDLAKKQWFAE